MSEQKQESLVEAFDKAISWAKYNGSISAVAFVNAERVNRIRAALEEFERLGCWEKDLDHIPDAGKKPEPSGLEKLDAHIDVVDPVDPRTPLFSQAFRDWQREHDRLMLEEVDRRIDEPQKRISNKFAQQDEAIEQLEQRLIDKMNDCAIAHCRVSEGILEQRIVKRVAEAARHSYVETVRPFSMTTVIGQPAPTDCKFSAIVFADKLEGIKKEKNDTNQSS